GIINQLAQAMFEARLPPGFTVSQFSVLNHLLRVKDGRTPLDLARAFQVPKTTMTHSLAVLERRGLIKTAPNPEDGRSKCVWITEEGRAFRDAAVTALATDVAELTAQFPSDRLSEAMPVLVELRRLLDSRRD
ncbi:MAG: MarR family winged helix-turn-helix transcriptional regulator, partial [Paracoccaceae bacterium]